MLFTSLFFQNLTVCLDVQDGYLFLISSGTVCPMQCTSHWCCPFSSIPAYRMRHFRFIESWDPDGYSAKHTRQAAITSEQVPSENKPLCIILVLALKKHLLASLINRSYQCYVVGINAASMP